MSLADEALEESATTNRPSCSISYLDPKIRAEIDEALARPGVTASALERILARRGITAQGRAIRQSTLGRHRRGGCSCESG